MGLIFVSRTDFVRKPHFFETDPSVELPGTSVDPGGPKINRQMQIRIYLLTFSRKSPDRHPTYRTWFPKIRLFRSKTASSLRETRKLKWTSICVSQREEADWAPKVWF